jgi:hypothetical protein
MTDAGKRLAAASGVAFVILFVASAIALGDLLGSVGDPDRQFTSHFDSAGNRAKDIAGSYVLAGAALAFTVFVSHLRALLRGGDDDGPLPSIALACGAIVSATLVVGAIAFSAIPTSILYADMFDEEPHEFGADVMRLATQLGFTSLVFGMLAAAVTVAATSLSAMRHGVLPRWLCGFGYICAAGLLFAIFFMPLFLLALWALLVAIVLARRGGDPLTALP